MQIKGKDCSVCRQGRGTCGRWGTPCTLLPQLLAWEAPSANDTGHPCVPLVSLSSATEGLPQLPALQRSNSGPACPKTLTPLPPSLAAVYLAIALTATNIAPGHSFTT